MFLLCKILQSISVEQCLSINKTLLVNFNLGLKLIGLQITKPRRINQNNLRSDRFLNLFQLIAQDTSFNGLSQRGTYNYSCNTWEMQVDKISINTKMNSDASSLIHVISSSLCQTSCKWTPLEPSLQGVCLQGITNSRLYHLFHFVKGEQTI